MIDFLLIFLGAGTGGILRYLVAHHITLWVGQGFPLGTLVVNVSGSFVMGVLYVFLLEYFADYSSQLRALLLIGLLGGYTTFSSFSIESVNLIEQREWLSAFSYIFLSFILCIGAAGLGVMGARQL